MAADRLEIQDVEEGTQETVPVADGPIFVTVTADGGVHLGADVRGAVLQIVPTMQGRRVEPVAAGGQVTVNGEELYCKDLAAGDVVELGRIRMRWLPGPRAAGAASAAPAPRSRGGRDAGAGVRGGRSDRSGSGRPGGGRGAGADGASGGGADGAARGGGAGDRSEGSGSRGERAAASSGAGRARERAAAAGAAAASPRRRPVARRRSLALPLTLLVVAIGVVALGLRACMGSTWPRSPQHFVDLARSQYQSNQLDQALATLDFALREATGEARANALELQQRIRRTMVMLADGARVQAARRDQDLLVSFRDRYLRQGAERPAAREFVRMCDAWLAEHREACSNGDEGRRLLREVEAWRTEWLPLSGLPGPDEEGDVLFAARAKLRFQVREYRAALALLDAFLLREPGNAAVRQERARMLQEGEEWLRDRLQTLERALERGDRDYAGSQFRALERDSILPEWDGLAAGLRQRLAR